MFIYKQKINFTLPIFLEILQRYCKIVILGALGKSAYTHQKFYRLVENFPIYLQAKEPLQPHVFHGDIAKICKLPLLGTLGMSGFPHLKW